MKRTLLCLLLAVMLTAPAEAKRSKEQKEWIAKRDAQPLTFTVSEVDAPAAWARAKEWIARFADLPIQHADETIIQTVVAPNEGDARPQLVVTRSQLPTGEWTFRVDGTVYNIFAGESLRNTGRALAYYVASGVPYPPDPPKGKKPKS